MDDDHAPLVDPPEIPRRRRSGKAGSTDLGSEGGYPTCVAKAGADASVPGAPNSDPSTSLTAQPGPSGDGQRAEIGSRPSLPASIANDREDHE